MRYLYGGDPHLLNILRSQTMSYVTNNDVYERRHKSFMKGTLNNVISLNEK